MIKRVEFSLNLSDPIEAAIFEFLADPLRHHRAGVLIRQALAAFLLSSQPALPSAERKAERASRPSYRDDSPDNSGADDVTERILEQSAAMFGF